MTATLIKELTAALRAAGNDEIEVVDSEIHRQGMDALRRQRDREAIAQGLAEMESGEAVELGEARRVTRERASSGPTGLGDASG